MEKITNLINAISGYKTYLAGVIAVGIGIWQNDINLIMTGLVAMGLRNAIK
jgi:hypothetical protein